jgi:hypothetical protein
VIEMIYEIFSREVKSKKDDFSIVYYLETRRNGINVIYEYTGIYFYDYRRYIIKLNYNIQNEQILFMNILRDIQKVYDNFSEVRKLSIIAKYIVYTISKIYNIPLYKLVKAVQYEANGNIQELSTNAFTKSVYRLVPKFEKIIS